MNKVKIPSYTLGEEIANSSTHGLGAGLAIAALVLMIIKAVSHHQNALAIVILVLYGVFMFMTYIVSCIYHGLSPKLEAKKVFRVIDHCDINMFILGTIAPVAILGIKGWQGWTLFGLCSFITISSTILSAINVDKFSKLTLALDLLAGWIVLLFTKTIITNLPLNCLYLILAGGISYTIGAILYATGKKHRYAHSIFHVFVLLGSILQWLAVYLFLI